MKGKKIMRPPPPPPRQRPPRETSTANAATAGEGGDGYLKLRDVQLHLDAARLVATAGSGGLTFCFWLYLHGGAPPSSIIIRQACHDSANNVPFLAVGKENSILLFPILTLHKEAPSSESLFSWYQTAHLLGTSVLTLGKWIHVGCEIGRNYMRLHINGGFVAEVRLSALPDEPQHAQNSSDVFSLLGNDGNIEGYLYGIQISSSSAVINYQVLNNSPVKLSIDISKVPAGIERVENGIWTIVGGKDFSVEVVLVDAFGQPVYKSVEVVASLIFAESGIDVEQSVGGGEAPLVLCFDSMEYPSLKKPLQLHRGRAKFQLKIRQMFPEFGSKIFRVSFRVVHSEVYPFLVEWSPPIRCISPTIAPLSCGKRAAPEAKIIDLVCGNEVKCPGNKAIQLLEKSAKGVPEQTKNAHVDADEAQVQQLERLERGAFKFEQSGAKNSEGRLPADGSKLFSDADVFRYCLEGTYERSVFLKTLLRSATDEDILEFADEVCMYSGCSHHRNQILISKQLTKEGDDVWAGISKSKEHVMWFSAVTEINREFMLISHSASRSLSEPDVQVLQAIAGCGDEVGREEFDRLWRWLYPVALSLSRRDLRALWECTSSRWIEGLITKEEAENALRNTPEMQRPGTFVLRFPTSRSWPHPDAGNLVVTYFGVDLVMHHRLLSLDDREGNLQDMLLLQPELTHLVRVRAAAK